MLALKTLFVTAGPAFTILGASIPTVVPVLVSLGVGLLAFGGVVYFVGDRSNRAVAYSSQAIGLMGVLCIVAGVALFPETSGSELKALATHNPQLETTFHARPGSEFWDPDGYVRFRLTNGTICVTQFNKGPDYPKAIVFTGSPRCGTAADPAQ